jgi:transcription elongation factor GreA
MSKFPITSEGYSKLEEELKHLKYTERPAISKLIAEAREFGDLSENAEYHAAREKQSFNEGRILELEDKMARADIIDISKISGDKITFGAIVKILDDESEEEFTYQIVGEYEADISKGLISVSSPIAKALIGKKTNDFIEVKTPKGIKVYQILSFRYGGK